jgi:hypothetical protein
MSSINVNLPVPAANGAGATQNVAALGPVRQIVVGGSYVGNVHIQVSNEVSPGADDWVTVASFTTGGGSMKMDIACINMRAVMAGFVSGTANADVSAWDQACEVQVMVVPAGAGAGTALNVANMDAFKSVVVGGAFTGQVIIEGSDDGTAWVPWQSCTGRAALSGVAPFAQMRVRRSAGGSGTPVISVGSGNLEYGGGDNLSIAQLAITQEAQDEGTPISAMIVTGGAHTDLSNAEAIDVLFDLSRTVNFDGGGAAFTQRAFSVEAPNYTADAAQTIDVAATLYVQGPPTQGANVTLTASYAIWVGDGPVRLDQNGIGVGVTDASIGLLQVNNTDAGAGAQQKSPILVLEGQGWKTNATAGTMEVQMGFQVVPVQGAAAPTAYLDIMANINDVGFTSVLQITSAGAVLVGDGTVALPSVARSADPDTGFYFAAAEIHASINAAEHFRIAAAAADTTSIWVVQGSLGAMRQVTLGADAGGFRALRVTTA